MRFNPSDWYWIVAGSTSQVYSSARNIYVPLTDTDYLAWLAATGLQIAPDIGAEADLWPYVADRVPAWCFDGATFAQPALGAYMPAQLFAYSAAVRFEHEVAGAVVNGMTIATDRSSQAMISGAYNMAARDAQFSTQWKTAEGVFVSLDAAAIIAVATAVGAHVASCFAKEVTVAGRIASGDIKTPDAIDAAYSAV